MPRSEVAKRVLRYTGPVAAVGLGVLGMALLWPLTRDQDSKPPQRERAELAPLAASGNLPGLHWPNFTAMQPSVENFYQPSGYALTWVRNGQPTPQAAALMDALEHADTQGLDPRDYDGPSWKARSTRLLIGDEDESHFDLALTVSVLRYVTDLRYGKANPEGVREDLSGWVREHLTRTPDPVAELRKLDPPFAEYRRLLPVLAHYRSLAANDATVPLPPIDQTVDPGQPYGAAPLLAERLRYLGDLPDGVSFDAETYSGPLVDAVRRFQTRHGLEPDGRIGPATLAELNTPLDDRVRQLELTLERWRWLPREYTAPPLVANIPEFRLRAYGPPEDGVYPSTLEMKVVAGGSRGRQTPGFHSDLAYLIFYPYWNVPMSIQRWEIVPALRKDPNYLVRNAYEIVTPSAQVVTRDAPTPELIDQLQSGRLHVRQLPGPKNALGGVKFVFPNENNVYMHDTPAQSLFERSRRDFSHGCIRLENPAGLAALLLRDQPEWTPERIAQAMRGPSPLRVNLGQPVPVHIVYHTAVASPDGEAYFYRDIYQRDGALYTKVTSRYGHLEEQSSLAR